jgi:DNA-binding MarR family transcriptional regulator
MNPKASKTARKLADSVSRFLASFEAEQVPPGWYNLTDIGKTLGIQQRSAERIVKRMERVGQSEKKIYRVFMANHLRPVLHYRFTPAAEKALGLTGQKRKH